MQKKIYNADSVNMCTGCKRHVLGCTARMANQPVATVGDVLSYWYDQGISASYKRIWFVNDGRQQEVDDYISERFADTLKAAEQDQLNDGDWSVLSPTSALARILVLDQFSRHFYRDSEDRDARVSANDKKALELTETIMAKKWDKSYTIEQLVFVYMPLRHSATVDRLETVLAKIDERVTLNEERADLLRKFRKTSLRRLHDLQNKSGDADDILEFHPFQADESSLLSTSLTKTIHSFLAEHKTSDMDYILLSLSGGVDSMVLAYCCLRLSPLLNNIKVVCAHIDYNNRKESTAEANFLKQWCENLGIDIVIHTIDDIQRGVTPRDEYEKKSRDVRYNLYKKIMKNLYKPDGTPAAVSGVLVGHHQGDVQENVISNMMKGCSLLEVAGMAETSVVNGVTVWRPMMPHEKKEIFDFAHKYGIPYFKDTTPRWSTRGKLRNQLLPTLADVYGDGFTRNLSLMASDSAQLHYMCLTSVFRPFWDSMVQTPMGVYFDVIGWLNMPIFFWKQSFRHVCHDMLGIGMIGEKSAVLLLARMRSHCEALYVTNPLTGPQTIAPGAGNDPGKLIQSRTRVRVRTSGSSSQNKHNNGKVEVAQANITTPMNQNTDMNTPYPTYTRTRSSRTSLPGASSDGFIGLSSDNSQYTSDSLTHDSQNIHRSKSGGIPVTSRLAASRFTSCTLSPILGSTRTHTRFLSHANTTPYISTHGQASNTLSPTSSMSPTLSRTPISTPPPLGLAMNATRQHTMPAQPIVQLVNTSKRTIAITPQSPLPLDQYLPLLRQASAPLLQLATPESADIGCFPPNSGPDLRAQHTGPCAHKCSPVNAGRVAYRRDSQPLTLNPSISRQFAGARLHGTNSSELPNRMRERYSTDHTALQMEKPQRPLSLEYPSPRTPKSGSASSSPITARHMPHAGNHNRERTISAPTQPDLYTLSPSASPMAPGAIVEEGPNSPMVPPFGFQSPLPSPDCHDRKRSQLRVMGSTHTADDLLASSRKGMIRVSVSSENLEDTAKDIGSAAALALIDGKVCPSDASTKTPMAIAASNTYRRTNSCGSTAPVLTAHDDQGLNNSLSASTIPEVQEDAAVAKPANNKRKRRTKDLFFGLKKGLNLFLCDSTLFFFAPEAFPSTPCFEPNSPVNVGEKYRFGLWEVQLTEVSIEDDVDTADTHCFTVRELWQGDLSYTLRGGYQHILVRGKGDGRPKALRQIDVRLTKNVPLVNFDNSQPDPTKPMVLVTLKLHPSTKRRKEHSN
ncbi:hypothetical protein SARC_07138 [Sphaeroforma arctica JP610]|uniref:tRNA(Ile)-lysidine synthetase n=1 Tax=Sphaeroforma arctica JP610 TaxID=667725 RepID=A0A0L0FVB0_9EUKA|nr:hypothetical protein SARC_07138 [Sphaeroforma arctica JP610]KNC80496.1 hypothetical protein SARC_07138 [Sphaeroforma arctica JP610]|eukprot:XP_014154398.1 hypothetical protein SARC_07138 [Sphaeroforma arctica JP610]